MRILLLASEEANGGKHTGYTVLGRHVPGGNLIVEKRREPRGWLERLVVGVLSRLTCSRWYRWGSLRLEWKAWRMLSRERADLVHVLWGDKDLGFMDMLAQHQHLPFCVTAHCCPDTLPGVFQKPERLQKAAAIILMSEHQRDFFESCGVPSEKIHVVHHGVDCEYFTPRANAEQRPFTVLSVGNYRRNFERLKAVCVALKDISFRVIAPPHWKEFFADTPNVKFETGLSDEELRLAYQEASCLLMTLDAATANNAIVEAMASGLAIISEDVGGVAEYCGRQAAILCKQGSVEEISAAIVKLRDDTAERERLGAAARARAEELAWLKVAARMLLLYERVLADYQNKK